MHEVFENVTPGHGNCVIKTHENVTIGNVRERGIQTGRQRLLY